MTNLPQPPDPGPAPEAPGKRPLRIDTDEWHRWLKVNAAYERWLKRNRAFVLWHCRYLLMDEKAPAAELILPMRRALVILTTMAIEQDCAPGGDPLWRAGVVG